MTKRGQCTSYVKTWCSQDEPDEGKPVGTGLALCCLSRKTGLGGWFYRVQSQIDGNLSLSCFHSTILCSGVTLPSNAETLYKEFMDSSRLT